MNMTDLFLLIVLAAVLSAAVWIMVSNRKKGKGCGCGCAGCTKGSCGLRDTGKEEVNQ